MITAGIDLGAQPERTAVASIKWTAGRAVIENVVPRADDEVILQMVKQADKTGIDCPFGWPDAFVEFVTSHHAGHLSVPADGHGSRRNLTMRRTDVFVYEQLRLTPLSVSADRIAHVALRCAVLLAKFEAAGGPVNRSGSGPIAEVYPAASLRSWGWITAATSRRPPPVRWHVSWIISCMKRRGWTAPPTSRLCGVHTTPSTQLSLR